MAWTILLALCAFRQFPYPIPDSPPPSPPNLFECICTVWMVVAMVSFLLPRPWFVAIFRAAFPFMPEHLDRKER